MPVLLAHGALGPFDELIFSGVSIIFVIMMAISWLKSRATHPPLDKPDAEQSPIESGAPPADSRDRFRLD